MCAARHAELAQAGEAGEFVGAIVGSGHTNQQISKSTSFLCDPVTRNCAPIAHH
jgi:hypothetical protein